ncbi:hypothetical protein SAMN02745116_00399 [Pilibacter termitis]|uniref:Uncharacterized protein n=1 Tax=Pilibacter termitis TaxID=263852 RepID=A0A1T4KUE3_9ENTE|nr:hypothetical protein [Pilibacter termitis]SJZ46064.1 hypothetical protein SAMN02745116_00399 [Pilibacter termitis]
MEIKLNGVIAKNSVKIELENQTVIQFSKDLPKEKRSVILLLKENSPVFIGENPENIEFDKAVSILPNWELEPCYLVKILCDIAKENGIVLEEDDTKIPKNQQRKVSEKAKQVCMVLEVFGVKLEKEKKKPAKAQHRWSKEVSQIEFFIDTFDSRAVVLWQKRNEMLIRKGAKMREIPPLNKDGSVGFGVKMAEKIRFDNQEKFSNLTTNEDIVLKSVNEVGLFLYFGGTNGWLELKDKDGKTIDEWTVVK